MDEEVDALRRERQKSRVCFSEAWLPRGERSVGVGVEQNGNK